MEKAKVYFTDFRTQGLSLPQKLDKLIQKAGIDNLPLKNAFTAIKIHFGEPGNVAYIRPNYAKVVVDRLKKGGSTPFLTDCNTLYVGRRRNALDHLEAAYENGFSPFSTGCHVIIADGLNGNDHVAVPIEGEYLSEALIGRAAVDADIIISMNHFKCHESTGTGGALKNLGMGLGSTAGKRVMHYNGKPIVNGPLCIACRRCFKECAHNAIHMEKVEGHTQAYIEQENCVGCGRCVGACRDKGAIKGNSTTNDLLNYKIAEYALASVKDKPHFHITLVMDISPYCDCHSENDAPIIPDVGMFASFDPVALDTACAEACNKMPALPNTVLSEKTNRTGDVFNDTHPTTNWRTCVEHAQKLGLGTMDYELITV